MRESSRRGFKSARELSSFLLAVEPGTPSVSRLIGRRSTMTRPSIVRSLSSPFGERNFSQFDRRAPSTRMETSVLQRVLHHVGDATHTTKIFGSAGNRAKKLLRHISEKHDDHHGDVLIRKRGGRVLSIPQEERYTSSDWKHILMTTPSSIILKRIREPVLTNMVWAAMVWAAFQRFGVPKSLFTQLHNLIGSSLGLLLVFRTNAAYQRFWEGRTIWENLLGDVRGLARMIMMYHTEMAGKTIQRASDLVCVFSSLLAEHLGHTSANMTAYRHLLTKQDQDQLDMCCNHPLWAINALGKEIKDIPDLTVDAVPLFSSRERLVMLSQVDKMCKQLGKCERLVQTPVPLNYVRHTSRVLWLWCFTLPFALAGGLGFSVVLVVGLVTWVLYGIQEIGLMIEDPFKDALHLDFFVQSIYKDVFETTRMIAWLNGGNPSIR